MIEELKLVNRNDEDSDFNETPFNGSSDIDFTESGSIVRCTGEEGLEQNLLKAILTGIQPNGYGTTEVYGLLGKKNIEYVRTKLLYEIISTFNILKKNQLRYLSSASTYNKQNIIAETTNIKTDKIKNTSFRVTFKVRSLDNQLINENLFNSSTFILG